MDEHHERDERPWLVVDVMNVVGSRPDGWWRDRTGAAAGLVRRLALLAAASGERITAVVDGTPDERLPDGLVDGVEVHHAGRGRDAADDRIVELVGTSDPPATVVTADRRLAERVRARGAAVVGPISLLARLPAPSRTTLPTTPPTRPTSSSDDHP